jgi:hypothetical protein
MEEDENMAKVLCSIFNGGQNYSKLHNLRHRQVNTL